MTIFLMIFCVNTELSMKEIFTLNTMTIGLFVLIIETMYFHGIIIQQFSGYIYHISLLVLSVFFQFFLHRISHIYVYIIDSHININMNNLVPSIHNLFRKLLIGFGLYTPDCIVFNTKFSINIITTQIRTDNIK